MRQPRWTSAATCQVLQEVPGAGSCRPCPEGRGAVGQEERSAFSPGHSSVSQDGAQASGPRRLATGSGSRRQVSTMQPVSRDSSGLTSGRWRRSDQVVAVAQRRGLKAPEALVVEGAGAELAAAEVENAGARGRPPGASGSSRADRRREPARRRDCAAEIGQDLVLEVEADQRCERLTHRHHGRARSRPRPRTPGARPRSAVAERRECQGCERFRHRSARSAGGELSGLDLQPAGQGLTDIRPLFARDRLQIVCLVRRQCVAKSGIEPP